MTRAERIDAVLRRVAPRAMEEHERTGRWPVKADKVADVQGHRQKVAEGKIEFDRALHPTDEDYLRHYESDKRQAPYVIFPLDDGRQRILVTGDDGDTRSGVGTTLEDALTALEAKLS